MPSLLSQEYSYLLSPSSLASATPSFPPFARSFCTKHRPALLADSWMAAALRNVRSKHLAVEHHFLVAPLSRNFSYIVLCGNGTAE